MMMSKRLQVLFEEAELREIKRAARRARMTTAEWVRTTLRAARRTQPAQDAGRKLDVVRAAARHSFPAPEVPQMLAEIERGYARETDT
jgi:hypothetical protein